MMKRQKRLVMHVDDDSAIRNLVRSALERAGYEVLSIADPTTANATLLDTDCRVVLLDVDMPGINGLDLLQQIKNQDGGVQVIMLTGLVSMSTMLQSMRCGAEACLFKPIEDFEQLKQALTEAFVKVDRWWSSLQELSERKNRETASLSR
ncbi:MAG: response regulator [Pirellulales bacterium]